MSVLANAKSNRHRKRCEVEPGGGGRKFTHLTRGGLRGESRAGVSRGRSSEEAGESRQSQGPKDQVTDRPTDSGNAWHGVSRNARGVAVKAASAGGARREVAVDSAAETERGRQACYRAKGGVRRC